MKTVISKIVVSVLMIGSFQLVNAQKIDSKAKKILEDVTANYNSKKNSYFKFTFGSGVNGTVTKTETGIFYSAGEKYKLKIMETEQIFDGKKIYNINAEDEEITIAKPDSSETMFSPLNYLKTYRQDYNVIYNGKLNVNGVNADFIKLTPVKNNGIQHVYLFIDSSKKQLVKLEQHGTNKDVSVIAIKEYKDNQALDSNMFSFNKNNYKNFVVTEL